MSWVLILNSDITAKPPAVVGGYKTREEAEQAGNLATAFDNDFMFSSGPFYKYYVVIPGAACSEPLGCTHASVARNEQQKFERYITRYSAS